MAAGDNRRLIISSRKVVAYCLIEGPLAYLCLKPRSASTSLLILL